MKSWTNTLAGCLVFLLWATAAVAEPKPDEAELPIEDVLLPVELYDDGTVKTQIVAGRARIPAAGDIVATQVKIQFFSPDGELESRVMAERCRYDRQRGRATSDSPVRYERKGAVISGVGFEWHAEEAFVKILDKAKVVFRRGEIEGLRGLGKRPGKDKK